MAEGVQLATAYVNIEASTKGLGKQITQALGKVDTGRLGQQAGGTWGKGFLARLGAAGYASAGLKIGRQVSKGIEGGIDETALDGLKRAVESAEASVITASKNMKTAKLNEQAAQARVTETVKKYGETSSRAYDAQARLAQAELRTETASKTLNSAQEKLAKAQDELNKASNEYKTPNTSRLSRALGTITSGFRNATKDADTFRTSGLSIGAVAGVVSNLTGRLVSGLGNYMNAAVEASDSTDKFKSTLDFAGVDTETIDRLTKSTQAYADATVYDLADIRNVTAQLAANGVKDYDKLAEAAGNLNAVAGGNAETFKSVGMVLTQTAGQGKLTTENFNQLSDAIPGASGKIQQALRDMGAYTGNFRDAMEKGEISAEEFDQALMELGMTDAAVEAAKSTKTFEGAVGNWDAAVQKLITKGLDAVKPAFTKALGGATDIVSDFTDDISDNLDDLQKRFSKAADSLLKGNLAQAIGDVFDLDPRVTRDLGEAFDSIVDGFGDITGELKELTPGLDGANSVFGLLADTLKTVSPLLPVIADLVGVFADLPEPVQLAAAGLVAFHKPLGNIISIARGAAGVLGDIASGIAGIGSKSQDAAGKVGSVSSQLDGVSSVKIGATAGLVAGYQGAVASQASAARRQVKALDEAFETSNGAESYFDALEDHDTGKLGFFDQLATFQIPGISDGTLMTALDNANVSLDTFRRAVEGDADAMVELDAGADNWIEALGGQNMKLATVSEQAHKLRDAYKENIAAMVEATQTADGIDRAYANLSAGMGELGTTLKANGDSLNDLSSMSDASRGALQQFSASVWQNVDSIIANADAYGGMDQAVQTAKNRVQEMRDALINQLQALGQTPEQAAAVADALGLIPSDVTTDVRLNAGDAKLEVQAYLDTLNLTPEQKTTFMQALTDAANGDIDGLKLNMDTLPDIVTSFLKADPTDANAQLNAVSAQLQLFGLMEPTALLKADNSDAEGKTAQSTTSVRTFGTQTATAKEDADNSAAITKTDAAKGKVQEYGGIKATAVVDVMDNASGPLDGILGKLGSIVSGVWNAAVNVVTGGGRAYGGLIDGGRVTGPGSRVSDTAQITPLSAGEFVIRAKSASRIGYAKLDRMNETGTIPENGAYREPTVTNLTPNRTVTYSPSYTIVANDADLVLAKLEARERDMMIRYGGA